MKTVDRPRIGIDGYNLALPHGTGVATYGRNLAHALTTLGHPLDLLYGLDVGRARPELRETLFFAGLDQDGAGSPARRSPLSRLKRAALPPWPRRALQVPLTGRVVANGFEDRLPPCDRLFSAGSLFDTAARYFRRYGRFMGVRLPQPPAVMHWTYPLPIRMEGARNLYTIHDLVPLRLPYTSLEDKRYHERLIRACLTQADHVCTVSETSRRDILDLFPEADPTRVTNTYQSVAPPADAVALTPDELKGRLASLFDLEPDGYLLYFGALEPKKNIGRLIEAYLSADIQTPLVIVGSRAWKSENELHLLNGAHGAKLKSVERIRRVEHLPRSLLMSLVRGARAVAFPSLYEGFGLPVLEAMALGTPVLASTGGSLPEIAGEAALLVDPYDVAAIAAGLRRLDTDPSLRRHLADAGLERAQHFSAERFRRRIAALYLGQDAE